MKIKKSIKANKLYTKTNLYKLLKELLIGKDDQKDN